MEIASWINQLMDIIHASQQQFVYALEIIGLLWLIQFINVILHYRLNLLGIWPRKWYGLPGILFSPFLHGNADHLFFNSIPLFILVDLTLLYGQHTFIILTLFIMIISGAATWLMARPGIHVGASGVIMGYWGFLLTLSILHPSILSVIVALLCLYYLGSLWLNLFPQGANTSWEGHVFGCVAGIAAVFTLPYFSA